MNKIYSNYLYSEDRTDFAYSLFTINGIFKEWFPEWIIVGYKVPNNLLLYGHAENRLVHEIENCE